MAILCDVYQDCRNDKQVPLLAENVSWLDAYRLCQKLFAQNPGQAFYIYPQAANSFSDCFVTFPKCKCITQGESA